MIRLFVAGLLLLPYIIFGALAQEPARRMACAQADKMSDGLAEHSGERPIGIGAMIGEDSEALTIFINKETDTFTVAIVRDDGIMCIVAIGEHWKTLKATPNDTTK